MCGAGAGTGGAVGELVRLALGQRDEFLDRGRRHLRIDHQRLRHDGELGDAGERLAHVPRHGLADEMHGGRRRGRQVERVAVRRLAGDVLHGGEGAAAGPVLDHELLVELLGQVLGDQAREGVAAAARGGGDDDPDRPAGIVALRRRRAWPEGRGRQRRPDRSCEASRSSDDVCTPFMAGRLGDLAASGECGPNARFCGHFACFEGGSPLYSRHLTRGPWPKAVRWLLPNPREGSLVRGGSTGE